MAEEVKALPETLVLIMEGGPSGAERVLEPLKDKNATDRLCTRVCEGQNRVWTGSQVMCFILFVLFGEDEQEYVANRIY